MSRALSVACLSVAVLTTAAVPAEADMGRRVVAGTVGPQAALPRPAPAVLYAHDRHARLAPATANTRFATQQVYRSSETIVVLDRQPPQPRPIQPISVNAIDPGAVISRTPSGRILIGPPAGFVVMLPATAATSTAQPYAPPEFKMLGAPSGRHMTSSPRLTYGVKPPETLSLGPKVVWLDEAGRGADDDAGGRIKRLR